MGSRLAGQARGPGRPEVYVWAGCAARSVSVFVDTHTRRRIDAGRRMPPPDPSPRSTASGTFRR